MPSAVVRRIATGVRRIENHARVQAEPDPAYVLALTDASDDLLTAEARIAALEAEVATLRQAAVDSARSEADAAAARRERDRLQTDLDRVYGSLSWRVTRPLRALSAALRRVRRPSAREG